MKKLSPTIDDPTPYIQKMVEDFQIPGEDAFTECLLALPRIGATVWDAAIIISTRQSIKYYTDIFQFWVHAFFCFVEDTQIGSAFYNVIPSIACRKIPPEEFCRNYFALLQQCILDPLFAEKQFYPETYVELKKRLFYNPYIVVNSPQFKSFVANSDGEYVAIFMPNSIEQTR